MPGFLDKNAPSIQAEYSRYLDGDLLGKLVAKNFLRNRLGFRNEQIDIPLARHGDAKSKYAELGKVATDLRDGSVITKQGKVTFEIKCARINIANRRVGRKLENWAFSYILTSPSKKKRMKYDVLIAIGLRTLGLETDDYWRHLKRLQTEFAKERRKVFLEAQPHEKRFLTICSFFVIPMRDVLTNYFRLHVGAVQKSSYEVYHAAGDDLIACKKVWRNALKRIRR